MIPLVTSEQVKQAERTAIEAGTTEAALMLQAGNQIADRIHSSRGRPSNALILSGPGNNGGDGIVIGARLVDLGWTVSIWTWSREGVGNAPVSSEAAESIDWIDSSEALGDPLNRAEVVVDAIFGAGSRASLPEDVESILEAVRIERDRRYLEVWAVDLPSGTSSDTGEACDSALAADVTAMIGLPKIGAYKLPAAGFTGRILAIDIGLDAHDGIDDSTPRLITSGAIRTLLPARRTGVHKRSAGTVMVVGGAPNYYGAPRLAGEAALRAGAGLVSVAAPSSIIAPIATAVPELTFVPLPMAEHLTAARRMASIVREQMEKTDALIIGPGLGTDTPVPEFLAQLLGFDQPGRGGIGFGSHSESDEAEPFSGRAVIDADGLNWLSGRDEWWKQLEPAELVLTPHAGELARLLQCERDQVESDPWGNARIAAEKFGQVVVLKYAHSIVASPDGNLFIAPQAPPGLATAGTGDVLAGTIGAFLGQGLEPLSAAVAGMALGLRAAVIAESRLGAIGYTATDVIRLLPAAREEIVRAQSRFD